MFVVSGGAGGLEVAVAAPAVCLVASGCWPWWLAGGRGLTNWFTVVTF